MVDNIPVSDRIGMFRCILFEQRLKLGKNGSNCFGQIIFYFVIFIIIAFFINI